MAVRLAVAIALVSIVAAANAQESKPVDWRWFASERWGFRMELPADWRVEFVGPRHGGCTLDTRTAAVRPSWLALHPGDEIDTITVSFTRAPFDSVATNEGFARVGGNWFYGSDSASPARGEHWQSIEGQDVERVDHPDAAPGEPSFDFDNVFRAVARFDRDDGCALVLRVREAGHVNEDETMADVWPRVVVR